MAESGEPEPKLKRANNESSDDGVHSAVHPTVHSTIAGFDGFQVVSVLQENPQTKTAFVLGRFDGVPGQVVVALEKSPFNVNSLTGILDAGSTLNQLFHNDVYGTYDCLPDPQFNSLKATIIHPATQKHIDKYSRRELFLINESADDYKSVTLPYLEKQQFSIQWVYNILEGTAEADRVVFDDPDPDDGFVLLPDMKWNQAQVSDLYLIALCRKRGIKSIRDLTAEHLPLLRNIKRKATEAIKKKYALLENQLRVYFHYQPSYYHLHIHWTHLSFQAPGIHVERAHLLSQVIANLETDGKYYQTATLAYTVSDNDLLYKEFQDAGKL